MASSTRFHIVLLLGSYDSVTVKVLSRLRENLSNEFVSYEDNILILLIDNIEIYTIGIGDENQKESKLIVITEKYNDKLTLFTVNESTIIDAEDLQPIAGASPDETVRHHIRNKYNILSLYRHPVLEKLQLLASAVSLAFLIRHRHLTRGGEYIELAHLLASNTLHPSKIYFLKKEGFDLSQMALEILDQYQVNSRSYRDEIGLNDAVTRILKYFLRGQA